MHAASVTTTDTHEEGGGGARDEELTLPQQGNTASPALSFSLLETLPWSQLDNIDFSSNLDWMLGGDSPLPATASMPLPELQGPGFPYTPDDNQPQVPLSNQYAEQNSIFGLPSPCLHQDSGADDPWPMEWHAAPAPEVTLDTLGLSADSFHFLRHQSLSFDLPSVTSEVSESIQRAIQMVAKDSPWAQVNLNNFPEESKISYFIDLYFMHFHPVSYKSPGHLLRLNGFWVNILS